MAEIPKDFGQGGAFVTPEGSGTPGLKTILDDIADDLADGRAATIASPDGVAAAGANPTKAEYDAVVLLVNELKAALNAATATAVRTTKA
jgi:predicted regulator of Ras-like GTPase activity (Roadblock/LC7/MglB family)